MFRQDFQGREYAEVEKGRIVRRPHKMQSKQDGKNVDEVNEPWHSTQMKRTCLSYQWSIYNQYEVSVWLLGSS